MSPARRPVRWSSRRQPVAPGPKRSRNVGHARGDANACRPPRHEPRAGGELGCLTVPAMTDPDAITIRTATPADYPAIADLTVDAYAADGHLDAEEDYRSTLADVAGRASAGEILVAVEGHDVLGAVLLVQTGSDFSELAGPGEVEFRMLDRKSVV